MGLNIARKGDDDNVELTQRVQYEVLDLMLQFNGLLTCIPRRA